MSYTINPLSEEELDVRDIVPKGTYDFEVVKHERKISAKGNPMAAIQIRIWDAAGKVHIVYDWLVFSDVKYCIRKVKHFCESVGLEAEYKSGNIPEELEMLCGKVDIDVQDAMPNGKGGMHPQKNIVVDYVKGATNAVKREAKPIVVTPEFDDSIPF